MMQLLKIISIANKKAEIPFLAMVRSLRASGCTLPVWVIPYDNNKFDLPEDCFWWEIPEIINWIDNHKLWPAFKKIQCLTTSHYQFVDSDVIFLKDPTKVLEPHDGFISSCTHWNNPNHTITSETLDFLKKKSSTWPKLVFNSGQWACDRKLYDAQELINFCESNFINTLFRKNYLYKDQPGINLLVNYKDVPITNLTLPPVNMESTWAGDYLDSFSFEKFEKKEKPYILHWAGTPIENDQCINKYFFYFLSAEEKKKYSFFKKNKMSGIEVVKLKFKKTYHFIKTF